MRQQQVGENVRGNLLTIEQLRGIAISGPSVEREAAFTAKILKDSNVREAFAVLERGCKSRGEARIEVARARQCIQDSVSLGLHDGLDFGTVQLLGIAAAWQRTANYNSLEQKQQAAQAARRVMQRSGSFSDSQMSDVTQAILDTQVVPDTEHRTLHQVCRGRLSPWVVDGERALFGKPGFLRDIAIDYGKLRGSAVRGVQDLKSEEGKCYIASMLRYMSKHAWASAAGHRAYNEQKAGNVRNLVGFFTLLTAGRPEPLQHAWDTLTTR